MTRRLQYLAVAAILLLPCRAWAQSDSDNATASIVVLATVDVTTTNAMDFGSWPPVGTVASSDVGTHAGWAVAMDAVHDVQLSLALPPELTSVAGDVVKLTYGTNSARYSGNSDILFDPATGAIVTDADASFVVTLGEDVNGDGTGDVVADVDRVTADTYNGVITLTVTIL